MYPYGWFMLLCGRNQRNTVKKVSSNLKKNWARIQQALTLRNTGWFWWPVGEGLPLGLRSRELAILTEAENVTSHVVLPNLLKMGWRYFFVCCLFLILLIVVLSKSRFFKIFYCIIFNTKSILYWGIADWNVGFFTLGSQLARIIFLSH